MSLDFAGVDWTLGSYYIKAFVNGEPIGASQVKSVPFALMADGVSGVITKQNLIGTWGVYIDYGKYGNVSYTFNFNQDGTFSYSKKDSDGEDKSYACTGTWKLNNLGNIICQYSGEGRSGKAVLSTVYDKDDGGLWIGGSDGEKAFFRSAEMFYKQK